MVAVDSMPVDKTRSRRADWAVCSEPHSRSTLLANVQLKDVLTDPTSPTISGEWTGLLKLSGAGAKHVRAMMEAMPKAELDKASMPDLLRRLVRDGKNVRVVYTRGGWLDVNTLGDVVKGSAFQ